MTFRDLAPWLLAPMALLATTQRPAPTGGDVAGATAVAGVATHHAELGRISSGNPRFRQSGRLDRYCGDARHLLWKFVNTNYLLPPVADELRPALKGVGKKGTVAPDEDLETAGLGRCIDNPSDKQLETDLNPRRSTRHRDSIEVQFLIATLPDPVLSHLQHDFDSGMETLTEAAAQAGYSMDRFDLPWTQPEQAAAAGAESRDPETQPGLILFRRNCGGLGGCQLLVVFVVGETPTAGIHKFALASALEQVAELSPLAAGQTDCPKRQPGCVKIGVLAPYFTGSVPSLRLGFADFARWKAAYWKKLTHGRRDHTPPLHFSIVSGDADAVNQMGLQDAPFNDPDAFGDLTFTATMDYGVESRDTFLRFLRERLGVQLEDVAILREADTGYGQNFAVGTLGGFIEYLRGREVTDLKSAKELRKLEHRIVKWLNDAPEMVHAGGVQRVASVLYGNLEALRWQDATFKRFSEEYKKAHGYLDLPFPLHISKVREASEEQTASPQLLKLIEGSRTFFPVLTPKTEGKDLLPSFAEDLDKPAAALVMSNLLSTLSAERIHYVGIAASDVQDTIYLAREVHTHCPDTTVFSFGGDLLFLNPDVANDLRGMLVVGTYPLFTLNQHWTYPFLGESEHYQFSSERAEGLFNATLALLDRQDKMLDYAQPFVLKGSLAPKTSPPVWITAVGKEGFVPIAILPQTVGLSGLYINKPSKRKPAHTHEIEFYRTNSWASILLFWAATIISTWFALLALWPAKLRWRKTIWRARLRDPARRRLLALEAFHVHLLAFYLLVFPGLLPAPWWRVIILQSHVKAAPYPAAILLPAALRRTGMHLAMGWFVPDVPTFAVHLRWWVRATLLVVLIPLIAAALMSFLKACLTLACWAVGGEGRAAIGGTRWPKWQAPVGGPLGKRARGAIERAVRTTAEALSAIASLLIPVVSCLLVVWYLAGLLGPDEDPYKKADLIFAAWRYVNSGNGISPVLPLFFVSLAMVLWASSNVHRTAMIEAATGGDDARDEASQVLQASYLGMNSPSLGDLAVRQRRLRSLLSRGALGLPFGFVAFWLITAFLAATLLRVDFDEIERAFNFHTLAGFVARLGHGADLGWPNLAGFLFLPSLEGPRFDLLLAFLLGTAYLGITFNLLRTFNVWCEFRELLRRLSWHPLREACGRLGALGKPSTSGEERSQSSSGQVPELSLGSPPPTFSALEFSIEQAARLLGCADQLLGNNASQRPLRAAVAANRWKLHELFEYAKSNLAAALKFDALGDYRKRRRRMLSAQAALAKMSAIAANILEPDWCLQAAPTVPESDEDRWRGAAGLFLASRILDYSRHILAQLRFQMFFTIVGLLLMLMAVSSYPFPNSDTLLRFGWTMLLGGAAISVWILIQVSRDRLLSLLSGGTPGKIDWTLGFVGHLVLYGVLPVLTVLGIQFPATLSGIVQWVSSILPATPGVGH